MSTLRKKISVPLVFCSFNVSLVAAGLGTWSSAYEYDDVLPDGVKLFKTTVEEWPDLNAWLITADITLFKTSNGWDFKTVLSDDTSDNLSPIEQFASHFGAKIATNGGFFGVSSGVGKSYSLASGNNTLYSPNIGSVTRSGITYYPTRCAFGIDQDMKMDAWWVYQTNDSKTWAYDKPSLNAEGMPPLQKPNENYPSTAFVWDLYGGVGGGPMLVFDSENVALPSFEAEVMWGSGVPSKSAAARTAIGTGIPHTLSLSTEQLLLIIVDGSEDATGISLGDLSEEFLKLGARKACNLDGGGSTELAVNGALTNQPIGGTYQRPLAASVIITQVMSDLIELE